MPKTLKRFLRLNSGLIISLVMIGIALSGTWWGLVPFAQQLIRMYNDSQKLGDEIEELDNKLAVLSSMNEFELTQNGNALVSAVPREKDVGSIMSTIGNSANSVGLSVVSLTITSPGSLATEAAQRQSQEEKVVGAGIVSASVVVEGQAAQMKEFISLIHGVRRILRLRTAEISVLPGGMMRAAMALEAFYAPLPTTLGTIDSKVTPLTSREEELMTRVESFPVIGAQALSGTIVFPAKANPFSP